MASDYTIYEYYPSGTVKRILQIYLHYDYEKNPEYYKDKLMPYFTSEISYADDLKRTVELGPAIQKPLTDTSSPYWLPNILHD